MVVLEGRSVRVVLQMSTAISFSQFGGSASGAGSGAGSGARSGARNGGPAARVRRALVMVGVRKSYGAGAKGCSALVRVLDDVSLSVGAGEIVGVAGGAGAGKSTLLRCAAGVVRPEWGSVLWAEGEEGSSAPMPLYLDSRSGRARREFELALAAGVRLLLVDHARAALLSELRIALPRAPEGVAIVVSSRSSAELARVASRIVVLRDGRLHSHELGAARTATLVTRYRPQHRASQRNRSAARASSAFPAALALARMRST